MFRRNMLDESRNPDKLTEDDLLKNYIMMGSIAYEDDEQICKLKAIKTTKIPKGTLIVLKTDGSDDSTFIEGSKDDNCCYYDGMLIGMITDNIIMMQNVHLDMPITLLRTDGTAETRNLYSSFIKDDGNKINLYNDWRFWLLTTGNAKGFYRDFTQLHTYIVFPTHSLYNMLKRL